MALLHTRQGRVISSRAYINWPPRFDTIKPLTLEHLKTSIRKIMVEIPPNMC